MEVKIELAILAKRRVDFINKQLFNHHLEARDIGLAHGKMGLSLYFYLMSHINTNNVDVNLQKDGEGFLIDVIDQMENVILETGFYYGLAGIAFGIHHLIHNNFVDGDANDILEAADDMIFREIAHSSQSFIGLENGILGYLTYLLPRIENGGISLRIEKDYFFKQLLIMLINRLSTAIEEQKLGIKEPILFNITWELPICLMLLASVRKLGSYNYKVEKILFYLSDSVLSLYPRLQSNRLSLLVAMEYVLKEINIGGWKEHSTILKKGIDVENILYSELKDKNITGANGMVGIYWLINEYNRITSNKDPFHLDINKLLGRILQSTYWGNDITKEHDYNLLYGLPGMGLLLSHLIKEEKNNPTEM